MLHTYTARVYLAATLSPKLIDIKKTHKITSQAVCDTLITRSFWDYESAAFSPNIIKENINITFLQYARNLSVTAAEFIIEIILPKRRRGIVFAEPIVNPFDRL